MSVRLDALTLYHLKKRAAAEDRTVAAEIRRAIKAHLEDKGNA